MADEYLAEKLARKKSGELDDLKTQDEIARKERIRKYTENMEMNLPNSPMNLPNIPMNLPNIPMNLPNIPTDRGLYYKFDRLSELNNQGKPLPEGVWRDKKTNEYFRD